MKKIAGEGKKGIARVSQKGRGEGGRAISAEGRSSPLFEKEGKCPGDGGESLGTTQEVCDPIREVGGRVLGGPWGGELSFRSIKRRRGAFASRTRRPLPRGGGRGERKTTEGGRGRTD